MNAADGVLRRRMVVELEKVVSRAVNSERAECRATRRSFELQNAVAGVSNA